MKSKYPLKSIGLPIILFTIAITMHCVILPPYVHIGDATCSGLKKTHVSSFFSADSNNQIRGFYSYSDLDSVVLSYKNANTEIIRFLKGKKNGAFEVWHNNGNLHTKIIYDNGMEVFRTRQQFDSLGNPVDTWKDSSDGYSYYESQYPSKKTEKRIRYKNGLIYGDFLQFRENGAIASKVVYSNGIPDPKNSFCYDLDGRDVLQSIIEIISNQRRTYSNLYGQYLYKNPSLGGIARFLIFFDPHEKKVLSIILSSNFNCTELLENMNKVIMHQQFGPLKFNGNETIIGTKEFEFRGSE